MNDRGAIRVFRRRRLVACDVLNNSSLETLASTADSVLAVDRWLWFLAVENTFADEDSYLTKGSDYQLYYEPESGRLHPLEYDGNESFITRDASLSPFAGEDSADRPVISRLLAIPALRQRYLAHVRTTCASGASDIPRDPRSAAPLDLSAPDPVRRNAAALSVV